MEETPEILMERTLDWYDPRIPISNLPYGIASPNGREAENYTRNFNWHWANLCHNRRVKMKHMYDQTPPGLGQIVKRPRFNLPSSNQEVVGDGDGAASEGEGRRHEFQDSVTEVGSGSGGGKDDNGGNNGGNMPSDEGAATRVGEEQRDQEAPPDPFGDRVSGVRDGWVVFATHPHRGRFVINEGVVLVGDRYMVCGGFRQGFYAVTMPAPVKAAIRENAPFPFLLIL
ncbi:uncharacterized protein LOC113353696 [Papaver somniferum]|uniref:uncharacterized protein LOC113353696 n=1 Tax=Papaver somniferum TaxID=3469 RepID=UPI000E701EBD|nr:uncharacterized protein LOC113353696 [Papaver somniferum]